jgi:hypothetical protein
MNNSKSLPNLKAIITDLVSLAQGMTAPGLSPRFPIITTSFQVRHMDVAIDTYADGSGRITLKTQVNNSLEGFSVEYELYSSKTFSKGNHQNAVESLINHPFALIDECESPAEVRFYLFSLGRIPNLMPQVEIGKYRVDFALVERKIVIEIDGHDYHKTREQRTRDAQRERYLQLNGWRVIRFTGSEIYKDPSGCVAEVAKLLDAFESQSISWESTLTERRN